MAMRANDKVIFMKTGEAKIAPNRFGGNLAGFWPGLRLSAAGIYGGRKRSAQPETC
jgi:hypothetical protein